MFGVPFIAVCCKMLLLFITPLTVMAPFGLVVLRYIQSIFYFILVFLLATNATGVTFANLKTFIVISIYQAYVDVEINCVFLKILEAPKFASQLMFVVLGIDRFIVMAFPYHHKEIVATKFACYRYAVVLLGTDFAHIL